MIKKFKPLWLLVFAFMLSLQAAYAEIFPAYLYTEANQTLYLIKYDEATMTLPDTWQGESVTWSQPYYGYDELSTTDLGTKVEYVVIDASLSDFYDWYSTNDLFNSLSKVKRLEGLQYININENTESISGMFRGCSSLQELDLSHFNTVNVRGMGVMFQGCSSLTRINLSSFNTSQVEDFGSMFAECESLTTLDLSNFDTQNALSMTAMFQNCLRLKYLNLNNFDGRNLQKLYVTSFLHGVRNLEYLDMSQAKNFSMEVQEQIVRTISTLSPFHFPLKYMPKGSTLTGPNVITTNDGTNFRCTEYVLSDDTLRRYTGSALTPNFNSTTQMKWEVNIPYGFTADKVTNTRKIGAKAGSAYTWFMPYSSPIPAGVEVYEFKEATVDGIVATFVRSTDTELKAQKPYLVKCTAGEVSTSVNATSEVPAYTPGNDVVAAETSAGWSFIGSFQWRTTQQAAEEGLHTLQTGNKWKHYEGSTARPRPFRAYLKKAGSGARELSVNFEDGSGITGIEKIELLDGNKPENNSIYDLNGRYLGTRRDVLPTGTYIIGGKTTRL